ncbi:hypothetical protein ACFVTZ_04000 [Cellulosimicrobium cellulans]|uniref:hypothetical protein n=1 Tax=Cellulosimicrobium cellulans TaxID=1710 RepID=UPI0036E90F34
MSRRWLAAIVVLVALTGCATSDPPDASPSQKSIVVDSFPAADADVKPPTEGATSALLDASTTPPRLIVTSWGSSGCVRVPQSVQWTDPSTVEVTTAAHKSGHCAANYEPISQVVELPGGHAVSEVTAVEVDGKQVKFTLEGEQ